MAKQYLLYVALHGGGDSSAQFDTIDEVVDAVTELTRNTFVEGHLMVTFSVGDISETVQEDDLKTDEVATPAVDSEAKGV